MHRNLLTQLPDRPGYIANETPLILKKQNPLGVIDLHSFSRFAAIRMGKGGPGTFYAESGNDRSIIVLVPLTAVVGHFKGALKGPILRLHRVLQLIRLLTARTCARFLFAYL